MALHTGHGKIGLYSPTSGDVTRVVLYNFDIDGAELKDRHRLYLDTNVIPLLKVGGHVEVTGAGSRSGSTEHNLRLSERRARAVVEYMSRRTTVHNVKMPVTNYTAKHVGESWAQAAGQKDGMEDEWQRAVFLIVSPNVIKPPPPSPRPEPVKPIPIPAPVTTTWRKEDLFFRADMLEVSLWKKINSWLFLTQGSLCRYVRWQMRASGLGKTLDPKGKPPVWMQDFVAMGASIWYDEKIYDPVTAWNDKKISLRSTGKSITITIGHALPAPMSASYQPVKREGIDILGQDISFTLTQNGFDAGGMYLGGSLGRGRLVSDTKCHSDTVGGLA